MYVQYGCGRSAPAAWVNFDVSPTLRIQQTPLLGRLLRNQLNVVFPEGVRYGDIIAGLPVAPDACDGVYCSHTLEHLALDDLRKALRNTYAITKPGGRFRCVVPDLEWAARRYIAELDGGHAQASIGFLEETLLGIEHRPRGLRDLASVLFGNRHHLWMWDHESLTAELRRAGFREVRRAEYGDSEDGAFALVEDPNRFERAAALEAVK